MTSGRVDQSFSIVPALSTDLDTLVAIESETFATPWTLLMFEAELTGNPFSRLLVAKGRKTEGEPGEIVGYICYWVVFEELRFLNVAVPKTYRGKGIGRRLIEFALQDGVNNHTKRAVLEVRTSNVLARQVYESLGFRAYGSRKAYYTNPVEDAILMEQTLLDPGLENTP